MHTLNADIAVIGASLGGVLAAWRAAQAGHRVLLAAEHHWLGGQMTAQGVPPDEHRLIEHGGASQSYLDFRAAMRAIYRDDPDFVDRSAMTEGLNPGDGWVSRLCFEPRFAAQWFEALLAPEIEAGRLTLLRGLRPQAVQRTGRHIDAVTLRDGAGVEVRVEAAFVLDATDTGALLPLAGLPYRLGKESRAECGEADAPEHAAPLDQQPVTHVIALRRQAQPGPVIDPPPSYDFWRAHVLPHYGYRLFGLSIPGSGRGQTVQLPLFGEGATLDLWRYRRVVAAHQWRAPREEVSLINWAQNDYGLAPLLDGRCAEAEVEQAARELSLCLLHWLQTEAPRPDGGRGAPELQPAPGVLGDDPHGLAQQVYVRESRRIKALTTLSANPIVVGRGEPLVPHADAMSVGIGWYNMDIHPTVVSGHGVNARVRPFALPLGCFVALDCDNLIPACKNLGVTHLVNAATRVHPIEWLIGEVAGLLACTALDAEATPCRVHDEPALFAALQAALAAAGIPIAWDEALSARLNSQPVTDH